MAADDPERKTVRARSPEWRRTGELPALAPAEPVVLDVRQLLAGGAGVESFPPAPAPEPRPAGVLVCWQREQSKSDGWDHANPIGHWPAYAERAQSQDLADL